MELQPDLTLHNFQEKEVIRTNDIAEVILTEYGGKKVRLIGFVSDAEKHDDVIRVEAYKYYKEIITKKESM